MVEEHSYEDGDQFIVLRAWGYMEVGDIFTIDNYNDSLHEAWHGTLTNRVRSGPKAEVGSDGRSVNAWHQGYLDQYMDDGRIKRFSIDTSKIKPGDYYDRDIILD